MRKKVKIVIAILLLCTIGLVAPHILRPEPKFQGKPVSRWLQQKTDNSGDWGEVTNAFYQIGPSAVPYIANRLRRDHSGFAKRYQQTWPQLPGALRKILPAPGQPMPGVVAVNAFHDIGSNAIPSVTALLSDPNPVVRSSAAWALESFQRSGQGDAVEIAKLIHALEDSDAGVRSTAARALGGFGQEAVSAIAPLILRLKDDDKGAEKSSVVFVRAAAARSLGKIGPSAKAAAPMLSALSNDAHFYTRMEADIALWRVQRNVSDALPKLTNDLSQVDEHSKWEIFEALAEMGPAAKGAVPVIAPNLKSKNPEVRQRAAEALWKIDPAQAPAIVEALIEPMNDPRATRVNPFSVTQGAKLLGEMGPAAESAAPSLETLLKHSYLPAQTAAAEALARIGPVATVGQQNAATNGNQPIRPETNSTPSAADSHH